jgi:hypothetical protein
MENIRLNKIKIFNKLKKKEITLVEYNYLFMKISFKEIRRNKLLQLDKLNIKDKLYIN